MPGPSPDTTLSAPEFAGLTRADQRRRWLRGDRVAVEGYLARHPALGAQPEVVIDLVYHESLLREERGEAPRLEEYQRRFPLLADPLRRRFDLHRMLAESLLNPASRQEETASASRSRGLRASSS
jgi:hypothetical protein